MCREKEDEVRAEAQTGYWEGREAGKGSDQGLLSVSGVKNVLKEHQGIIEKCMWLSIVTRSVFVGFGSLVWA